MESADWFFTARGHKKPDTFGVKNSDGKMQRDAVAQGLRGSRRDISFGGQLKNLGLNDESFRQGNMS